MFFNSNMNPVNINRKFLIDLSNFLLRSRSSVLFILATVYVYFT